MKLYLTSVAAKSLHKIDLSHRKRVAFITTASYFDKNPWYVDMDRDALKKRGLEVVDIDIKGFSKKQLEESLHDFDVIFVAGGNSLYLLEQMNHCDFKNVLISLLTKGAIYIGSSAGSIVMCPDIEYAASLDDPSKANLTSYHAMDFIKKYLLPHADSSKYGPRFVKIMSDNPDKEFILLHDDELVVVDDDGYFKT